MTSNLWLRDERLFHSAQTNPAPILRQATRRLVLAAVTCMGVGLAAGALFAPQEWLILILMVVNGNQLIFRWLARRGTRGLALAPARLLDERQLQEVHSAYRRAYGIAMMTVVAIMFVFAFGPDFETGYVGLMALVCLMHLMIWLPTSVLAWRLEDEDPMEAHAATA